MQSKGTPIHALSKCSEIINENPRNASDETLENDNLKLAKEE